MSDFGSFSQEERVLHVDAEIAHRVLDLRVTEQNLDGADVSRRPVIFDAFVRRSEWVPYSWGAELSQSPIRLPSEHTASCSCASCDLSVVRTFGTTRGVD